MTVSATPSARPGEGMMARPVMTYELAHRAAWDAGNVSMRAAGRTKWNEDDWNAMCAEFERLWPLERDLAQ